MNHLDTTVDLTEKQKQDSLDERIASGQSLPEEGSEYLALYKRS